MKRSLVAALAAASMIALAACGGAEDEMDTVPVEETPAPAPAPLPPPVDTMGMDTTMMDTTMMTTTQ